MKHFDAGNTMKITLLLPILSIFVWALGNHAHANKTEAPKALDRPLLQSHTVSLKMLLAQSVTLDDHADQTSCHQTVACVRIPCSNHTQEAS